MKVEVTNAHRQICYAVYEFPRLEDVNQVIEMIKEHGFVDDSTGEDVDFSYCHSSVTPDGVVIFVEED